MPGMRCSQFMCATVVFATLLALSSAPAMGGSVLVGSGDFTGSRSIGSGLAGVGTYGTEFKVTWAITLLDGVYTYAYTFSDHDDDPLSKEVSHSIIETSASFTSSDILSGSSQVEDGNPKTHEALSASNPHLPADIFGIKFEPTPMPDSNPTVILRTTRAPIWGDFYVKDGKTSKEFNEVWNLGVGTDPTTSDSHYTNWIPTPDTEGDDVQSIPLPAAAWMGLAGLAGVFLARRRRRKTQLQL